MSHLTDQARAPYRGEEIADHSDPNSLEAIVAANPSRRTVLRNGLFGLSMLPVTSLLAACDSDGPAGPVVIPPVTPTPTPTPTPVSYTATFGPVAANKLDTVTVPAGYEVAVILKAGDSLDPATPGFVPGSFPTPAQAEKWAGGNHDGMELFPIPNFNPNLGGILAINFEFPDYNILMSGSYNAATATADQKAVALSAVGIGMVEVGINTNNKWEVKAGSRYNKRYTGNTNYRAGGPAAGLLSNPIKGMLNNCASGRTP